jgi:transposase
MPGKHLNRKSYRDPDRRRGQHLTERERTEILTLYNHAGWNQSQIARELRLAISTVRLCIKEGYYTPRKPRGRPPLLTIRRRYRLIKRATQDGLHRRMSYQTIAALEGIQACRRTLTRAFIQAGYNRRVAKKKPLLTDKQQADRLAWAQAHAHWDFEMWKRVLWTDEASFTTGGFGVVYVTRKVDEAYDLPCLVPKFRGYSSWMAHGCISGTTKGPLVVFEKELGKVTARVYTDYVLPGIYRHLREMKHEGGFLRSIIMEDNASIHTARLTKWSHQLNHIIRIVWPANSPDLNPIENVWRLLKYRIGRQFPYTNEQVRQYLEEEWAKLQLDDFVHYIQQMPERCQAVIAANGGHTKW